MHARIFDTNPGTWKSSVKSTYHHACKWRNRLLCCAHVARAFSDGSTPVPQRRTIVDVPTVHPDELALFAVEMLGRGGVGEGHLLAEGEACQRARANIWERVGNILPIVRNICAAVCVSAVAMIGAESSTWHHFTHTHSSQTRCRGAHAQFCARFAFCPPSLL